MAELHGDDFLQALGWAIINNFWQVGLLWCLYLSATFIFPLKAHQKYILSLCGIFLSLALFVLSFSLFYIKGADPFLLWVWSSGSNSSPLFSNLLLFCAIAYVLILFIPAYKFYLSWQFTGILKRTGLQKAPVQLRLFIKKHSFTLHIQPKVHLYTSTLISSPLTVGFIKPIILIPLASINNLTTHQLEAILLHELSHILRKDYLMNMMVKIVQTLLYFNPFLKKFVQVADEQRENVADEFVLQFGYNPQDYAASLFQIQKKALDEAPFTIYAASKDYLLHRIKKIVGLEIEKKQPVQPRFFALLGLIAISFFILHSKLIPKSNPLPNHSLSINSSQLVNNSNSFKNLQKSNS